MSNSNRPSPEVQAIIDSFRRPDVPVAAMEAEGFTHVQGECASCGSIVMNPFRLMRLQKKIKDTTTLAQIGAAYRCKTCGGRQPVGEHAATHVSIHGDGGGYRGLAGQSEAFGAQVGDSKSPR
jgi:ribosomal protein S27E